MLPLAIPTFTGGPQSPVKQVDVYKEVSTDLQTSLASKVSAFDSNLGGAITGATKMVKGVGDTLKKNGIDLNQARNMIKDALGGSRGAITDIAELFEREITGDITGIDEGTGYVRGANTMIDSVKLVIDGSTRLIKDGNYKNVNSVMQFIGDLSGNKLIGAFNLGAEAALVKGILGEVSAWGIPDLVDETFGAMWNDSEKSYKYTYDDDFRFSVTKRASESLSPSTSLEVIERMMLHAGDKALIADNPGFPQQLLAGYVFPEGIHAGGPYPAMVPVEPPTVPPTFVPDPTGKQTVPNYIDQRDRLIRILDRLMPKWFYVPRKVYTGVKATPWRTDTVWTLQYINTASEAARTILMTSANHRDAMLAAPFYRVESGVALLKTMYPYFVDSKR